MQNHRLLHGILRVGLALFLVLPVLLSARASPSEPEALVRIDLRTPEDADYLAKQGLLVYGQFYTWNGASYLLAPLSPIQAWGLRQQGFSLKTLDSDSHAADYYLVTALLPGALEHSIQGVHLLQVEGDQAVARLDPEAGGWLVRDGVELRRLQPHLLAQTSEPASQHLADISPNPEIQAMINQVSMTEISNTAGSLSGEWSVIIGGSEYTLATRYSRTTQPIQMATQYVYEHFTGLGLDTVYHEYELAGSGTRRNVIAEQPGLTQPGRIFIITAHLDSTSYNTPYSTPYTLAPGADDNASGSTAVLLAAKILSQYAFNCTLRYALFTGEEQGLYGSQAYAEDALAAQEDIEGVLNLDMIATNDDGAPIIQLYTRPANSGDLAIAGLFSEVVAAYGVNLTPEIMHTGMQSSDHASFWDYGFPAILAIEDLDDFSDYYHSTGDTLSTLDLSYFTDFVKAAVGTFAHMGCLQSNASYLAGTVTQAGTGEPITGAHILARDGVNEWVTNSLSGGDYRLELSPGIVEVSFSAPGYLPYQAADIGVTQSTTTTLNASLEKISVLFPEHLLLPLISGSAP